MKKTSFAIVAALFAFALPALAAEITLPSPLAVKFDNVGKGQTDVWSTETARVEINRRLLNNIPDSGGWGHVAKARLKIGCPTGKVFKGIPVGGLTWQRIDKPGPPDYTGGITKITCE